MDTNEIRRQVLANRLKWGLGLIGAALISPVVFLAVKGIIGLAIAAAVGTATVQLAPVFSMKLANVRMKMLMSEASKNPIETLENRYADKAIELRRAAANIVEFETAVRNYDDKLAGFKVKYPQEAAGFQETSDKMHIGLQNMKTQQVASRKSLELAAQEIEKAKAIWDMSLAALQVTKFSKSAEQEVFEKIKRETALDSVSAQLNRSFASLNQAIEESTSLLPPAPEAA